MDKCKYYLTDKGVTLTFNSDAELTEFIKNNYSEQGTVKPGVSDLFESNSELANAVYEALIPDYKERLNVDKYLELHKDDFAVKVLNKLINNGGIMMSSFSLAKQGFVKRDMNQKMNDVDIIIPESNDDFRENPLKWMENIFGKGNVKLLNDFKDSEDSPYTNKFFLVGEDSILFSEMKENGFLRGATVSIKDGKEWIKVDTAQFDIGKQPVLFDKSTISAESTLEAKRLLAKRGEQKHIDDIKNWKWFEQQKQQAQQLYSQYLDTIFPDSKIKDIVYHHSNTKLTEFKEEFPEGYAAQKGVSPKAKFFLRKPLKEEFLSKRPYVGQYLINIINPNVMPVNADRSSKRDSGIKEGIQEALDNGQDSAIFDNIWDNRTWSDVIVVFEPKQIHILGSKQDIEGFKEFVKKPRIKYSKVDSGQLTKAEQVLQHINKSNPAINYDSSMFFSAYDFLREKHDISGNGIEEYLSPDLNEDNYIEKESLRLIKEDPTFKAKAEIDKEQAITEAKAFLKAELKVDKRMEDVSIAASKVIRNIIANGNGIITLKTIEPFLKAIAKYNQEEYTEGLFKKDQQDNLINIFKKWYEQNIQDSGYLYKAGVMLNKQQQIKSKSGVSSFLTYMAINKYGIPNLINVKVSRDYFSNWHSAKKLNAFYHLGVSRQILNGLLPDDISTDTSLLQVLPIITPLDSNGKINIESVIIAEPQIQQNLDLALKIQQNLQRLLPNPIKENTTESMALIEKNSQTLNVMLGKYQFRTKLLKTSAEKKAQEIIDRAKENKASTLKTYDLLLKTSIEEPNTPQGQENFKKRIAEYYERYNANQHSATLDIMRNINAKKYESEEFKRIFERYNNPNWELITNRPELTNAGVLLFRNNLTLTVEAIGLTINQLDQVNNLGFGTTIVGKFDKDTIKKSDPNIWDASNAHIEGIKVMTVLNSIPDLLKKYTINKILIYDIGANNADWINTDSAIHNFSILVNRVSKDIDIKNNFSGYSPVLKMTPKIDSLKSELLEALNAFKTTSNNEELRSTILNTKMEDLSNNKLRLDWFLKLREHLYKIHPELTKIQKDRMSDFSNPVMMLNLFIAMGISYYSGIHSDFDFDVPQLGIRVGDFTHILKTWINGQAPRFDSQGNKLVGMFQGQWFNTTDALQSSYMTRLHDLISLAQNKITTDYNKIKNIVTKTTREMYAELGRSDLERLLIGNAEKFHEVFFEKDGTKISTDFILKNPWSNTSDLDPTQRKYLKRYVYFLYLYGKNANTSLDTFEKFEKSEELKQMLDEGTIKKVLTVPLVRKQSLGRLKTITSEGLWKYLGNTWDSMLNQLDVRDMTGEENELEQKIGAFNSINGFGKMYNRFDSQESAEFRDYLITSKGVNEFEVNLDTLILKYAFENLRESYFNEVLPKIDAALEVMKFYGWQTGKSEETEKALEDFFDQVKISIFNISPVQGKESEQFFSLVRSAQKATSLMVLAFRPVTAIKELIVGTIKNTSFAWSKIYGDDSFDGKDLAEAYQLMIKSKEDYQLIWELNDEYRIANRDMNQIVDKTKVDRHGLNFFSNLMYWSNTAPDYINRMALFLAKMIKDGVYSAHTLNEDGNLVYDVTKDERYSYYLSKRKTYGLQFTGKDIKYDTQRSLYLTKIKAFNDNIISKNEKILTENDLLPAAYTQEERESIKTFTELAYGYYDHERSPLIKHLPMGIMFGQFMTFWPAKIKYYFGGVDTKSKRGKFAQKYREENGKKINYFVKFGTDENGEEFRYEVPETELSASDPRIPAYGWIGDPHEGLMYSLGLTVRALLHPDESIHDLSDTTINNAKLMIHDLLVAMMAILLGILLFNEKTNAAGTTTTNWKDLGQYEKLAAKILQRSTNEFNPFKTLTDLSATPVFITNMRETGQNFVKLFDGEQDTMKFFSNTFSFLEVIPNPTIRN